MLAFFFILFVICSCSPLTRNPSNIFDRDDRLTIEREKEPAVGRLMSDLKKQYLWGTAFHISSCHIVSAYHVVKDTDLEMNNKDHAYFISSLREKPVKAHPVAWGKPFLGDLNQNDWVILKLDECLSVKKKDVFTFMDYQNPGELRGRAVELLGFPEDRHPKNIHLDSSCKFGDELPEPGEGIGHNCATRPGNSGGPLFVSRPNSQRRVAAIAVASRGYFVEIIEGYSPWIANTATPAKPIKAAFEALNRL